MLYPVPTDRGLGDEAEQMWGDVEGQKSSSPHALDVNGSHVKPIRAAVREPRTLVCSCEVSSDVSTFSSSTDRCSLRDGRPCWG